MEREIITFEPLSNSETNSLLIFINSSISIDFKINPISLEYKICGGSDEKSVFTNFTF